MLTAAPAPGAPKPVLNAVLDTAARDPIFDGVDATVTQEAPPTPDEPPAPGGNSTSAEVIEQPSFQLKVTSTPLVQAVGAAATCDDSWEGAPDGELQQGRWDGWAPACHTIAAVHVQRIIPLTQLCGNQALVRGLSMTHGS